MLVQPYHNDALEKNYDHTIFDARTMFVYSLHVCDVNILVIRDFTQYVIAVSLKFVLVLVFIRLVLNDPTTNSTSKVGNVL